MNATDLLIIYLAFGAPIAVYKYLQSTRRSRPTRLASSVFTLFFWMPTAVRMGYLYLTNADLSGAFVSGSLEDGGDKPISAIRDSLGTELIRATEGLNVHEVRDTLERYAGLATAVRGGRFENAGTHPLLEAAGRIGDTTGTTCLNRRNQNRLERHHKWARQDFLMLFEYLPERPEARSVCNMGLEMALRLEDQVAYQELTNWLAKREAVWMRDHEQSTAIFAKHKGPLAATTSPVDGL